MTLDSDQARRSKLGRRLTTAVAVPLGLLVVLGAILGSQIYALTDDLHWVDHTDQILASANQTLKEIVDQETGERGYVVTGDRLFLEPFQRAHPLVGFATLQQLTVDNPAQAARFQETRRRYQAWLDGVTPVLQATNLAPARDPAEMRRAKDLMDEVRDAMQQALTVEEGLRRERIAAAEASNASTKTLLFVLLAVAAAILAFVSRRQLRGIADTFGKALLDETQAREEVEAEAWIRAGVARVIASLQAEQSLARLGATALEVLASYAGAEVGAFFARDGSGWRRRAGYALDGRAAGPESFEEGEGIVGRVAAAGKVLHLREVPAGFLDVRSGTGAAGPVELAVIPTNVEGMTNSVLELGFLHPIPPRSLALFERIGEGVGLAVRSCQYKQQLRELLEEAQRQAEELQTQQEELRVANEELDSQATALRATQKALETQQAELEQTNDHLVQQSETLERQNQRLAENQLEISAKAREVERASQFKSEFLSNMSHELRTPLNSSLILARLLADNRDGNLSAEQVKFAETIYASGNDLLVLINDVLDLSKIESGRMEAHASLVALEQVREVLLRTFEPMAAQKQLAFRVRLAATAPPTVQTDSQKLEQILKNLIANAIKFTDAGEVDVEFRGDRQWAEFRVRDTGIGVPKGQEELIFEAFRQADATAARKHGGTGLGLSISRELARLLGGDIAVETGPGKGSTFTLSIPLAPPSATEQKPEARAPAVAPRSTPASAPTPTPAPKQPSTRRNLLVIEDDEAFAKVLAQIAKEAGFEATLASTAQQGIDLARRHIPMGIVLDVKLPDHSGLSVLDRLKRDPSTRHIPVHVISGADEVEAALAMGAAAFFRKPVQREQLVAAIRSLEQRSIHRTRRVLVVEDDPDLRESVAMMLGREDVEISTAGSAAEALRLLDEHTFDCVVTDLTLPDQSGDELLETLATHDRATVPPIIIYTGRELTPDEEHRLRKYSRSIIVKGARSPERLLDEVTLFLHQVVSELSPNQQRQLSEARHREAIFEGRTILVVEDDIRNVFALTSALEPRGATVLIARNGKEALTTLKNNPSLDLVLMDIMMPEMDGLEATREIRKNPQWGKLPIIALTAKAMRDDQERALTAGVNDYLAKPLDMEMLLSLLRVWMPKA